MASRNLKRTLKRTKKSLAEQSSLVGYTTSAGAIGALLMKSDVLYLMVGSVMGALLGLLYIVVGQFLKSNRVSETSKNP